MINLNQPHPISVVEWLAGFTAVLTFFVMLVLIRYIWMHWEERWQAHIRIAGWFALCCAGAAIRNGWVWIEIFRRPELVDFVKVSEAYPMIGALPWVLGSALAAVGIVLLCREFGEAYIGRYTWLPAMLLAAIIPLISIWYY